MFCTADVAVLLELLHGEETRVWGDQASLGQTDVVQQCAPRAPDCAHRRYRPTSTKWSGRRTGPSRRYDPKVEHVFAVLKLKFGFVKVRYRGLAKNANRLFATCALVNLFLVRKQLIATAA